jgi:hypothetical protein
MTYSDFQQAQPPVYRQETCSLAIVSLVAGIVSYFLLPVLGAITAIITGGIAKKQIRESNGRLTGKGMANWGIILGWINIALGLIVTCIIVLVITGVIGSGLLLTIPAFE